MEALPANPLRRVSDEVVEALPRLIKTYPTGVTVKIAAREFGLDVAAARQALRRANNDGAAVLLRRFDSREEYLVPHFYRKVPGLRVCAQCGTAFKMRGRRRGGAATYHDKRFCCTRRCSIAWSWTRPGVREKRKAGIRAERATPEGKQRTAKHNAKRWSRPGERERLSEWNRKRWADPVIKAELSRAIAAVNGTPEMRKFYSDLRKALWSDRTMRQKMIAAIKASKTTPEARALFSGLLRERWKNPETRPRYMAAVRRAAKIRGEQMRGKKQSAEHVANRVAGQRKK